VGYTILYPAWPMVSQATPGILGFSTRAQVAEDIARVEEANAGINQQLVEADLVALAADTGSDLHRYADNAGEAVFNSWCVQCHGRNGAGAVGYPALGDDDWLWGGTVEDIHYTVTAGIRYEDTDPDWMRQSQMPAFGVDELLTEEEIVSVVNFVQSLSGEAQDPSVVEAGAELYEWNCASCHGPEGMGDRMQGAPNLADAIWLYGGGYDTVYETVYNSRYGRMPAMGGADLTEAEIRAVAVYVHGLGGGEAVE
jgi:cytochrome c oxidase cbb3-type subunit 3